MHARCRRHDIGVSALCPMIVATRIAENSARALGREPPAIEATPSETPPPGMKGGVIAAEDVARRVMRGIDRRDLYIFTHPEQREFLRRRAARQDAMFEKDVGES